MKRFLAPAFALGAAACQQAEPATSVAADLVASQSGGAQQKPRFEPGAVEAMKKQLLAEPKIKDVLYRPGRLSVEWQVAVSDDGTSRVGYAGYVCQRLREKNLVDRDTDVRVVDLVKVQNGDFRAASLGHVDCTTNADLGI